VNTTDKNKPALRKIGFISKLHGFKGELMCIIEEGDAEDYRDEKFLFLKIDGYDVPYHVEDFKNKNGNAIVKFEDVNDTEKAKSFLKKDVFTELNQEIKEEEFTFENILGFELRDETFGSLGNIEKLEEYPQQVIATCTVNKKEVLIPLSDEIISSIDEEKKIVFVDLPPGLIEIYLT
jgi:16S rRNA processing protein RimM